jgi:ADP-ribose pyrophosphatase YjhB (NUDIX family)
VAPRTVERELLTVVQGVVLENERVLLTTRNDLRGWELPGGNPAPGEATDRAVEREILEETGLEVVVERHVGDWVRTGFRPHRARIYRCRVIGGDLRPSTETPDVRWFALTRLPDTLFPWYHAPLAEALVDREEPIECHEHQGLASIWAGMKIDLRMRLQDDQAGLPPGPPKRRGP